MKAGRKGRRLARVGVVSIFVCALRAPRTEPTNGMCSRFPPCVPCLLHTCPLSPPYPLVPCPVPRADQPVPIVLTAGMA